MNFAVDSSIFLEQANVIKLNQLWTYDDLSQTITSVSAKKAISIRKPQEGSQLELHSKSSSKFALIKGKLCELNSLLVVAVKDKMQTHINKTKTKMSWCGTNFKMIVKCGGLNILILKIKSDLF